VTPTPGNRASAIQPDPTALLCPVPGCRNERYSIQRLMCAPCWRRVPKHLQQAVNRAWSRRRRDFRDPQARQAHEDAKARAIAAATDYRAVA
jgi:hypothetical protein